MAVTKRSVAASPAQVFEVLLDPYLYSHWVVGAKEIRGADDNWPSVGSAFYHRVGAGAADLKDKSEVLDLHAPHRIALRTFVRPLGIARVVLTAEPQGNGTLLTFFEEPEIGTKLRAVGRLLDPLIHLRNIEALRRLERVVQIRAAAPGHTHAFEVAGLGVQRASETG